MSSEEVFGQYVHCRPDLDPKFFQDEVTRKDIPTIPTIDEVVIEEVFAYLKKRGVKGGIADISYVFKHWEMDGSPGPGFSGKFANRAAILPFALANEYIHICGYKNCAVCVKEEVSKKAKFDLGDYRIILNHSTFMVFWGKVQNIIMDKSLADCGIMLKGVDARSMMTRIAKRIYEKKINVVQMDATKLDRTIQSSLIDAIEKLRAKFGPRIDWYHSFMRSFTFWGTGEDGKPCEMQSTIGLPSGKDATSEDETLLILLLTAQWLHDRGCLGLLHKTEFMGCGDDTHIELPFGEKVVEELAQHFDRYGIKMKVFDATNYKNWDLMGSTIEFSNGTPYPVWSFKKSLFRWSYDIKDETDQDRASRMVQSLTYLRYHPQYSVFDAFVRKHINLTVKPQYHRSLFKTLDSAGQFYVERQASVPKSILDLKGSSPCDEEMFKHIDGSGLKEDMDGRPLPETYVKNALHATGLSRDGAEWLEVAIDPFHDAALDPRGYPDENNGRSVVQEFVIKRTISKPDTVTDQNWDAHIHFTGSLSQDRCWRGNLQFDPPTANDGSSVYFHADAAGTTFRYGGVTVMKAKTGTDLDPSVLDTDVFIEGISPFDDDAVDSESIPPGRLRLIAGGMEVCNETPQMFKGGSVLGYQLQQAEEIEEVISGTEGTAASYRPTVTKFQVLPPKNIFEASTIPDSVTHEAEKGAYQAFRLTEREIPISRPTSINKIYLRDVDTGAGTTTAVQIARHGPVADANVNTTDLHHDSKFNPSGIYFTGLSPQTSLTLTTKWFVQYFPGTTERQMLVLAKPTPNHDKAAIDAYFAQIKLMPSMVTLAENGMGTWFKRVMKGVNQGLKFADKVVDVARIVPDPRLQAAIGAWDMAHALPNLVKKKKKAAQQGKAQAKKSAARNLEAAVDRQLAIAARPPKQKGALRRS
jgi:CRISPR/Cas system-associated endoribonuclease Cas2